jgi:transcriptional regulator with GAF, ATPase, and Fis domain
VGDLPADAQVKLLRVLQNGEFERVGGSRTIHVDVRVVAATHQDLDEAVHGGRFRSDLFYRLNVFPIRPPTLAERKEDIPALVRSFLHKLNMKVGRRIESIPRATLDALMAYSWPGNVRELRNIVERCFIVSSGSSLELGEWLVVPDRTTLANPPATLEEAQREHIVDALERTAWRVSGERGAARLLGIKPTTLEARMKKLGIVRPSRTPATAAHGPDPPLSRPFQRINSCHSRAPTPIRPARARPRRDRSQHRAHHSSSLWRWGLRAWRRNSIYV